MVEKMILEGQFNQAVIYTRVVDEKVREQAIQLLNEPFVKGEHIAIMPDTHIGKGAVIGTTMTTKNKKICPNLVGVDIGCGIMVTKLDPTHLSERDFKRLDQVIRTHIPSGFNVNIKAKNFNRLDDLTFELDKLMRVKQSLGSLGGGNHFIEVSRNEQGDYYLTVHTGSRSLGLTVANHHQRIAGNDCLKTVTSPKVAQPDLAYLEGQHLDDYLNDLTIAQEYAHANRLLISDRILRHMNWTAVDQFDSVHNYIDPVQGILRKGATDASKGTRLIIPLNMKDGGIIAKGKGNPEWNYSAPHGAGRVLSRRQAKKQLSLAIFKDTMKDIYSTSVKMDTLDEAPMAYKNPTDIIDNIEETVAILEHIRPVYNFKAS
ncbi:RtcB family protein [Alkalibacterium sp.]